MSTGIDTVEFEYPPDAEAISLRAALMRMQQDLYALQMTLDRVTSERNQWRKAYYNSLRERAEWAAANTKEIP